MSYLVSAVAIMAFALIASMLYSRGGESAFSLNVFLVSGAVGFAVGVWTLCIPDYFIVVSALMLTAIMINGGIGRG